MIDTLQIATMGLAPGFSTFHCATLGHYFRITIEIEPSRGGSDLEVLEYKKRRIIVTVQYKEHTWAQALQLETNTVLKIISSFRAVERRVAHVTAKLKTIIMKLS